MKILSNDFPTNMPDSEKVSQGGPANFAKLFINYLVSKTGHNWVGLMFENSVSGPKDCQKLYSFNQCDYYRLRVDNALLKAIVSSKKKLNPEIILAKPIKQIVKLIKKEKPDLIFLNGFGIYGWLLLKAGEMANIPVVIQHAGIWTKELSVHKKFYSVNGRKIMEKMEKDSTRIVAHEIFLNEWSKKYYNTHIAKTNREKTSIIPLPFDFVSFKKLSLKDMVKLFNFDKNNFHIGVIARWDEIKNHKAVLKMAKMVKTKKIPWIFHSVVEIPETTQYSKEREEYKKYIDTIPALDRGGIAQFCKQVDMLILPSLFDVSPTVVLEAIASDTPIVISPNIGFAHEFEVYGGNNWIVDFSKINFAIKRIKKLLGKKMPAILKKKIKANHRHKNVFTDYLKIFNRISSNVQ